MTKMGRPRVENPATKKVTVRFTAEEHDLLVKYSQKHDVTMTQVIKETVMEKLLTAQK